MRAKLSNHPYVRQVLSGGNCFVGAGELTWVNCVYASTGVTVSQVGIKHNRGTANASEKSRSMSPAPAWWLLSVCLAARPGHAVVQRHGDHEPHLRRDRVRGARQGAVHPRLRPLPWR